MEHPDDDVTSEQPSTPGDVLKALAEIGPAAETDDLPRFVAAADKFRRVFRQQLESRGKAGEWDELAQLLALEQVMAADPDLDPKYPAAVKTVRDYVTHERDAQARLN
jgi:hypothetical protein